VFQCKVNASIHKALRQLSYGFTRGVNTYGCYDINGYRFRSKPYEKTTVGLATTNSGVCVSSFDENDSLIEYYGVIKDVIKISWEGSMQLELVIFECDWFDPTAAGVRRVENIGLVEVKHSSRLSNFDPVVLASQVKQVYYLPYACKSRPDLSEWWVVHQVAPRDRLLSIYSSNECDETGALTEDVTFFQEEGLDGTFVIDLDVELDNSAPLLLNEIVNPNELEVLARQTQASQEIDENEHEQIDTDDEEPDDACYDDEDY